MLDPQTKALIELVEQNAIPAFSDLSPLQARELYLSGKAATQPEPDPVSECSDHRVLLGHGVRVPLRYYRPARVDHIAILPVLVYFHGGGWVMGGLETHDTLCTQLANQAGCAVVSVDYRLAPEHRFPAAYDDCLAVLHWLQQMSHGLRIDPARVGVGGDSAGAGLAAAVALGHRLALVNAAHQGLHPLRLQLLVYPVTQLGEQTDSYRAYGKGYLLPKADMDYFQSHYLGNQPLQADWRHSPLRAADHAGLPPALVLTAGYDPLRDDGLAYAQALSLAGNHVSYVCFERQIHGFLLMGKLIHEANVGVSFCADFVRRNLI